MQYTCPKTWNSLAVTSREDIRFCDQCCKKVYLCASQEEVDSAAELGVCVAFDSVTAVESQGTIKSTGKSETSFLTRRTLGLPSSYMRSEGKEKLISFINNIPVNHKI